MSVVGLTDKDWKFFQDLLIKSNNVQLQHVLKMVLEECERRGAIIIESKIESKGENFES